MSELEGVLVERKDGKFIKGHSGNPAGRPKGSKNAITLLKQSLELQLREQAGPDMGSVLDKAIELALDGDRQMIKLLLDKHMTAGTNDDAKATEKVAIQINSHPQSVDVIDITSETQPTAEESSDE